MNDWVIKTLRCNSKKLLCSRTIVAQKTRRAIPFVDTGTRADKVCLCLHHPREDWIHTEWL